MPAIKPAERLCQIILALRRPAGKLPETLTAAAADGDLAAMQLFLDHGENLQERSVGFASPLKAACSAGQLESVRWLIAKGAQLYPPVEPGALAALTSPITSALNKGDCASAALLLDAGVPIDHTALGAVAAAILGNLPMLQWLVARGLDLDATYPRLGVLRAHALQHAVKNGKPEIAAYLRGELPPTPPPATPPTHKPFPERLPPRATAAERPALLDEARALIAAAGKPAALWTGQYPGSSSGLLLISLAAYFGSPEILTALLDAGADPDFAPIGTPSPLYNAADQGHLDLVELLLVRGAKPNGAGTKSWLPLLGAALSGVLPIVQRLLEAGAKPKTKPAGGGTLAQNARGPFAAEIRTLLEAPPAAKATPKRSAKA